MYALIRRGMLIGIFSTKNKTDVSKNYIRFNSIFSLKPFREPQDLGDFSGQELTH